MFAILIAIMFSLYNLLCKQYLNVQYLKLLIENTKKVCMFPSTLGWANKGK